MELHMDEKNNEGGGIIIGRQKERRSQCRTCPSTIEADTVSRMS